VLINEFLNRPFLVLSIPAMVYSLLFQRSVDFETELDKLTKFAQSPNVLKSSNNVTLYYQSFEGFYLSGISMIFFSTFYSISSAVISSSSTSPWIVSLASFSAVEDIASSTSLLTRLPYSKLVSKDAYTATLLV